MSDKSDTGDTGTANPQSDQNTAVEPPLVSINKGKQA